MRNVFTIITLITVLTATISCKETKSVINTASSVNLDGTYNVTNIEGELKSAKSQTITFNALNKMISGNAGCNEFSGSYSIDVFALSVGILTSTKAYCEEPVMKQERALMKALKNTGSYGIKDGVLTLYSKTDRTPVLTANKAN